MGRADVGVLRAEHDQVQNTALGSFLLWRFAIGHADTKDDAAGPPISLCFLVLPMIYHEATRELVRKTRKGTGLRGFAAKFASSTFQQSDDLLALHERALIMRPASLEAIRMGVAFRLISIDADSGEVHPLTRSMPRRHVSQSVGDLVKQGEKIGAWFAQLTPFEVASTLKVKF